MQIVPCCPWKNPHCPPAGSQDDYPRSRGHKWPEAQLPLCCRQEQEQAAPQWRLWLSLRVWRLQPPRPPAFWLRTFRSNQPLGCPSRWAAAVARHAAGSEPGQACLAWWAAAASVCACVASAGVMCLCDSQFCTCARSRSSCQVPHPTADMRTTSCG